MTAQSLTQDIMDLRKVAELASLMEVEDRLGKAITILSAQGVLEDPMAAHALLLELSVGNTLRIAQGYADLYLETSDKSLLPKIRKCCDHLPHGTIEHELVASMLSRLENQ